MDWFRRRLKGWRTVLFGLLVAVLGLLDALAMVDLTPLLSSWLPEGRVGAVLSAIGILTVLLRFVTTGPWGSQPAAEPDWEDGA